ncbi:10067_t:CDS:2, partial [Acaulospora colombiana]
IDILLNFFCTILQYLNKSTRTVDSAKLMRQAAEILNSPAAMQIRYLETMSSMSKAAGTKVIFMPYNSDGTGTIGTSGASSSNGKLDPLTASVYQTMSE